MEPAANGARDPVPATPSKQNQYVSFLIGTELIGACRDAASQVGDPFTVWARRAVASAVGALEQGAPLTSDPKLHPPRAAPLTGYALLVPRTLYARLRVVAKATSTSHVIREALASALDRARAGKR